MSSHRKSLALVLAVGIVLSGFAFCMSWTYGQLWLVDEADAGWHLNNYIIVPCWVAYSVFGAFFLWFGCFLLGATLVGGMFHRLFAKSHWKKASSFLIATVVFVALGFNTLDYMCGWLYWNAGKSQPILLNFFGFFEFYIDPWNFYFFGIIMPLAVSGFLLSFSALWLMKVQQKR